MGQKTSRQRNPKTAETAAAVVVHTAPRSFYTIGDHYRTLDDVQSALRRVGLESSQLIIGIDYTKSNAWTGKRSFGGRCLHDLRAQEWNPYQRAIDVMSRTLEPFDDDKLIPVFGFGDASTTDKSVFPFYPDGKPCFGVSEVLSRYNEITPHVQMSGPTCFAPIIDKAVELVRQTKEYHILVIVADGQVTTPRKTREALVRASHVPLSIIMVGVGDGPWDEMELLDDGLPQRRFDNFQFVNFHAIETKPHVENFDVEFALNALMEVPEQFEAIRRLGYLE